MYTIAGLQTALAAVALAASLTVTVSGVASAATDALIVQALRATGPMQPYQPSGFGQPLGVNQSELSDLSVEHVSATTQHGATIYVYRLRNMGGVTAKDVKAEKVCTYQRGPSASDARTFSGWQQIGDLPSGASQDVTIACNPPQDADVVASILQAYTTTPEMETTNNSATATAGSLQD